MDELVSANPIPEVARLGAFCIRRHLPYESHDQKQNDRSYCGGNNRADNSSAKRETQAKAWEERASDQSAHNADDNIAYQAVACPLY